MVVMPDEFQELEPLGSTALLQQLRAATQQQRHVAYLFLHSKPAMMRSIFADRRQAFYRFALLLDLPSIPDEFWRAYLREKHASLGMEARQTALDTLPELTGGHPYSVMAVAAAVYYGAKGDGEDSVDADRIRAGWQEALDSLAPVFQADWDRVRTHRHAAPSWSPSRVGSPYIEDSLRSR